ncbi:MAG: CHAT domain-containing protein [Gammaproteobacteria bacterium]|nr:CHAT domain-containing protein [Gammaproteobacteria bacterium]
MNKKKSGKITAFISFLKPVFMSFGLLSACIGAAPLDDPAQEGQAFFQRGAYEQAIQRWKAAANGPARSVDTLTRLAAAYQAAGDYPSAYTVFLQALNESAQHGTTMQQVLLYSHFGDLLIAMQQPEAAKTYLDKGITLARTLDEPLVLAHLLNNSGNVSSVLREYSAALPAYAEVVKLAERAGDTALQIQALNNRGRAAIQQGDAESAAAAFNALVPLVHGLPAGYGKSFQLVSLGLLALRLQMRFPEQRRLLAIAAQALAEAAELAGENARLSAYAKGYLGEIYERMDRYPEALQLTREAIFLAQETPDLFYRWEWQRGRLLLAQQNLAGAAAAYRLALDHLQGIQMKLATGRRDAEEVFQERIRPVYYGYADVLLRQAAAASSATAGTRLLHQARDTIERLKAAELQDYFRNACISKPPKTAKLDSLDARTAVLYPIILPDRTELLLSLPDGIHQVIVPAGADELGRTILKFQQNLQTRTSWRFIKQSKKLYRWLIAPIRAKLAARHINTLVIVPDGPLRMIPLAALHNGKKYLVQELALAVTPGLNLTDPRHLPRQNINVLLNGLSESVQDFSALPNVPLEISKIKALYGHSTVLLDKEFSLKAVSKVLQASPYSIVHVASHGQFDRDPDKTFLLTYDNKLTIDRLERLLAISQFRNEPVELLTLSACQTATGDERAALGLAGVAIKAGARSALASLWFVNDEAASQLAIEFYRQLQNPDLSKAQALQNAQKKLLAQRMFRHPAYWSPFLLIGNWL